MTRVLITGSRTWNDVQIIRDALNEVFAEFGAPIIVVHGAARGADMIAHNLARGAQRAGVVAEPHPAKWDVHGRGAGMIRNREMVDLGADICLAFIKDSSPGATACARMAEMERIPVRRFIIDTKEKK